MRRTLPTAVNGATWSVSRGQVLQSCERKYFFQYLAGARLNSADPWLRGIALLKKLKNIAMWQGECVHNAIAEFLTQAQYGKAPPFDSVDRSLKQRVQRDWLFSEKRRFREEPASVGRFGTALFEHEYDEVPPETCVEELGGEATAMLRNFFLWVENTPDFMTAFMAARRRWIEPPAWGIAAPGFMVGNVQAIAKVDLAMHKQNGEFVIYDWKTGAPPKPGSSGTQNEIQVSVYMLWAHLALNLPLKAISSQLVYLGGSRPSEFKFDLDEERGVETQQIIADSLEQAQRWEGYVNAQRIQLDGLDFAGSVQECRRCNFERVCRAALSPKELP